MTLEFFRWWKYLGVFQVIGDIIRNKGDFSLRVHHKHKPIQRLKNEKEIDINNCLMMCRFTSYGLIGLKWFSA